MKRRLMRIPFALVALTVVGLAIATADEPSGKGQPAASRTPSAERGARFLLEKPYVPAGFGQGTFDALFEAWPEPLHGRALLAPPGERRRLAFERYGLTSRPGDASGKPLQFVVDEKGLWTISCLACHGGQVAGRAIPGLPNAHLALQDLMEDVAHLEGSKGLPPQIGGMMMSRTHLGDTHGTTNAVIFGIALLATRDSDLNVVFPAKPPHLTHHDLDAPAWWNVKKKRWLYYDGSISKSPRALMQFLLVPLNGPEQIKSWEADFRDILAYVESLSPPPWPYEVDRPLAARGRAVFENTCSRCHGTYGEGGAYPEAVIPIDEIGTDRLRFDAILPEDRARYASSWLAGKDPAGVVMNPKGYVAPPLDGIWATAPYFHNGSVPTLWHVLHPDARPKAWRVRSEEGYDRTHVGLDVEVRDAPPEGVSDPWERRAWFDTSKRGKSALGHPFPSVLSEPDRDAVLEYLKTL